MRKLRYSVCSYLVPALVREVARLGSMMGVAESMSATATRLCSCATARSSDRLGVKLCSRTVTMYTL